MSIERKKIVEVARKLTTEDAGTLAFLADLSKDFERTPFKVLEKMYERGLTEKDLVEYLKEIERKDLVALVQKKPKPRNRDINAVATGSEAFSSLLQTAVFNLTQVYKCLELEDREAQLSERDLNAIQEIEEKSKRIKQCVQEKLQWSSSDSSGDERTSSTESKKKPILPPMNRPKYGAPKPCTETDHAVVPEQPNHIRQSTPKQHPDSGFYDSARFSSSSFKLPDAPPLSSSSPTLQLHH